jgi:hypothetical protein
MKIAQRLLLVMLLCGGVLTSTASYTPAKPLNQMERFYKKFPGLARVSIDDYIKLSPREYEKQSGNKLKFKEKLVYKALKWKLKKNMKREGPTEKQKTLGLLSFGFGLLAVALLFIPTIGIISIFLAVAGFILGIKSLKGNSNAPGLIGLILSSTVLLIIIIAVLSLATLKAFD